MQINEHLFDAKDLLESIVDGVFIFDAQGHALHLNSSAVKLIGVQDRQQYLSLNIEQRLQAFVFRDIDGNPIPEERCSLTRLLNGEILTGNDQIEGLIRAYDGRELHINITGSPLRDHSGYVTGAVVVVRDITEQSKLERRTQKVLNTLFEIARAILEVPEQTHAQAAGDAQTPPHSDNPVEYNVARLIHQILEFDIVGFASVEQHTEKLHPLAVVGLNAEYERVWWAEIDRSTLKDYLKPEEISHLRADEIVIRDLTQAPFEGRSNYGVRRIVFAPMLNRKQLVGVLGMSYTPGVHEYVKEEKTLTKAVARLATLIIERERLLFEQSQALSRELALRAAKERMDTFIGIASHELRTPITALQGFAELLNMMFDRGQSLDTPHAVHFIKEIMSQSQRLTRLINDMLEISRIEMGRMPLQIEQHDLLETLKHCVEIQATINRLDSLKLTVEGLSPEDALPGRFDRGRIEQVLNNLIDNAAKYSTPGSEIEVGLRYNPAKPCEALLWVKDAGTGIAIDEVPHIFERFHRASNLDRSISGFGVGLYLVHEFVTRHGGSVWVETTEGKGSTFYVLLPLSS